MALNGMRIMSDEVDVERSDSCLQGLTKTMKKDSQYNRPPGIGSKLEHENEALSHDIWFHMYKVCHE
jgi:hypothetical protein